MRTLRVDGRNVVVPEDINEYWNKRYKHDLYRLTVSLASAIFRDARSAIDVGSYTSGMICELEWIPRRVATDIQTSLVEKWADVPGVEFVAGDAFAIDFAEPFDLVISNQTVEHLDRPEQFINKLLSIGRGLIVSTTYEVPAGSIYGHLQDPINLEKFKAWFPCELDAWLICHHPSARWLKHIVGVIKQSHPMRGKQR